jgi:hypothetical protein
MSFFLGLLVGACLGVIIMAMCVAAGRADDWMEQMRGNKR